MKPPQSHKPFLVISIAVALFVAALYAYMYWQVNASAGKAIAARNLAETERQHKSEDKDLAKLFDSTAEERSKLGGYFIPADSTLQFIEAMESLGPQAGAEVTLSSIGADPIDKAKPGTMGIVRAHVEAIGGWVAVYKTLLFSERLPYKLQVNNLHMDSSPGATAKAGRSWRMSFDVNGVIIAVASSTPKVSP